MKFKKLWLFERSEFQRFLNFIIAQFIAEIRPGSEIIYMNIYRYTTCCVVYNIDHNIGEGKLSALFQQKDTISNLYKM